MAAGIKCIHDRNVMHRDIKPENFLAFVKDRKIIVKLSDFGAAKEYVTMSAGTNTGTFNYMAPERLEESAKCTLESDIWSLGCVIFELLTGEIAFPGRNPYKDISNVNYKIQNVQNDDFK